MVDRRIGVIINGATGRMGTTQHMSNLLAIAAEGGLKRLCRWWFTHTRREHEQRRAKRVRISMPCRMTGPVPTSHARRARRAGSCARSSNSGETSQYPPRSWLRLSSMGLQIAAITCGAAGAVAPLTGLSIRGGAPSRPAQRPHKYAVQPAFRPTIRSSRL
jgi:hypothetical protein